MRIRNLVSVLLATTLLGAIAVIGADASVRPPARILVYAQEWSFWASRLSLPPGRVTVQLWNRGQDAHDLKIRRLTGHGRMTGSAQGLGVTQSGTIGEGNWRLAAGRYELYCSIPGHLRHGMHIKLLVR